MNTVILTGHLGANPVIDNSNGTDYARLRLASNERWKNKGGIPQDRVDWFTIVAFRGLAKSLKSLAKGDRIAVHGSLRANTFERDGRKLEQVEIHAMEIEFLSLKRPEEY